MGSMVPIIAAQGVSLLLGEAAAADDRKAARYDRDRAQADASADLETLSADRASQERERRDRLKRALASTRASLAGRGLAAGEGSGTAILDGLTGESTREAADDEADYRRRADAVRRGLGTATGRSLIAEGARERERRLEQIKSFGGSFLGERS